MGKKLSVILLFLVGLVGGEAKAQSINTVLSCGTLGEVAAVTPGSTLFRIFIDTGVFPAAVCNDGTPGVIFAKRGKGADVHRWLIYLQGGGDCKDGDSCAARWCSQGTKFGMDKMSSHFTPASIGANGIFNPRIDNKFRNWSKVFVYNCSSDAFGGTTGRTLTATGGVTFDLPMRGGTILNAVLTTLRRAPGPGGIVPPIAQYDETGDMVPDKAMPDLDLASQVLLFSSGSAAQAIGHYADRVRDLLMANDVDGDIDVKVLIDAGNTPKTEELDWSRLPNPDYEATMQARWLEEYVFLRSTQVDSSCLAYHQPIGDEWRCADPIHVLHNHISTPLFAREDVMDPNAQPWPFGRLGLEDVDFAIRAHHDIGELAYLDHFSEEGSYMSGGVELTPAGLFVPQCQDHTAIRNEEGFFDVRVRAGPKHGKKLSYHDVLHRWVSGNEPTRALVPIPTPNPETGMIEPMKACSANP